MKKLFRPIAAFFSAALLLTSCIDNTVSDQVNKIREAQVNLMNAQTRLREADAAFREAQTRQQEAIADLAETQAASAASQLEVTIATNAALVAVQEKALAVAIEDLRVYLLQQGATTASALLVKYKGAMGDAYEAAAALADERAKLARWNLLTSAALAEIEEDDDEDEASDHVVTAPTLALIAEKLERDIATEEAKLAAQEASLALLEEVSAGTADAEEELATLEAANQDLQNQYAQLNIDIQKATNDVTNASKAVTDLTAPDGTDVGTEPDGLIPYFEYAEEQVEIKEANLATKQAEAVQALADQSSAQTNYDNAKQLLDNYTATLVAKFTAFNTALSTAKTRFQAVKDKAAELEILQATKDAGGNVTDAQITAAKTAVTNAITTYEGSVGETSMDGDSYTLATLATYCGDTAPGAEPTAYVTDSVLDKAFKDYGPISDSFSVGGLSDAAYNLLVDIGEYNANNFLGDFEDGGGVIANIAKLTTPTADKLLDKVNDADAAAELKQDAIDTAQDELDEWETIVAELQADYTAAVAALPGLEAALEAAEDAKAALQDEQSAIAAVIGENESVIGKLEDFLYPPVEMTAEEISALANQAIEDKKDDIEATKDAIASLEEAYANNEIDLAKLQDYIAALEADIAEREGELEALEAIAAEYLELLLAEVD